jgi:DNA-binding transcriptional MerR regulator
MARSIGVRGAPDARREGSLGDRMPVEELARRTGVTVRNLRAMQARAVLERPELVGRKGFYTERHVARVLLVLKLQSRGFSLASIQALIESWQAGGGIMDVMGLEDALMTPGASGVVREVDVEEAFPELLDDPRALAKAIEQELVVERDGRYVAPNAELLGIVKQEVAAGFPLEALLRDGDLLLEDVERIAARFRKSFFDHVVNPHLDAGMTGAALNDVAAKVALLRPLSVRVVSILLARAIERGGGSVTAASAPVPPKAGHRKSKKPIKAPKGKR